MAVEFNTALIERDAIRRGWNRSMLARRAGVSPMTVSRFLNRQSKNPKTAKKLARALGYGVQRYFAEAVA